MATLSEHQKRAAGLVPYFEVVNVNDKGRTIGEDHVNARYLDSDVRRVIDLREAGLTYKAISKKMGIPIRTVRDYVSGRRRCQSVAGWNRVVRWRRG